jgi:hypothetical protein
MLVMLAVAQMVVCATGFRVSGNKALRLESSGSETVLNGSRLQPFIDHPSDDAILWRPLSMAKCARYGVVGI